MFNKIKKVSKLSLCTLALLGSAIATSPSLYAQDVIVVEEPTVQPVAKLDIPVATTNQQSFSDEIVTHAPLRLTPDRSEIVRLDSKIGSVIVGNPAHLNIIPESATTIIVVPRAPGASFFTILDENGEVVMQRHAIIAAPKEKYVRIRRSCAGNECQPTSVYYCPDMCHEIQVSGEKSEGSGNALADALADAIESGPASDSSDELNAQNSPPDVEGQ